MAEFSDKFASLDSGAAEAPVDPTEEALFTLPNLDKSADAGGKPSRSSSGKSRTRKSETSKTKSKSSRKSNSSGASEKSRTSKSRTSRTSSAKKGSTAKDASSSATNGALSKDPGEQKPSEQESKQPKPVAAKAKRRTSEPPSDAPPKAAAINLPVDEHGEPIEPIKRNFLSDSPSWLTSLALHLVVLLGLAIWSLPQLPAIRQALLLAEPSDSDENLDEIPEMMLDPVDLETEPVDLELQPETDFVADEVSLSTFDDASSAPSMTEPSDLALQPAPPSDPTDLAGFDGTGTTGRGRMARTALVRKHGGSKASETAVANALEWLAEHQNQDGTWSLVHNGGRCNGQCPDPASVEYAASLRSGTGLALLPFLGAGQTHKQGRHRKTVARGLKALALMGQEEKDRPGLSWRDSGNMYSHAIGAIALTEAYGMTGDASLRLPAQAAIDYIVYAQAADGGWRYTPGQAGDTSVTGWQIMALKSGYLSELSVPQASATKAIKFLDLVQKSDGSQYMYDANNQQATPSMSAVGLLCRMYLGWKSDKKPLQEGVEALAKRGPHPTDYYFNYYATQVLFQHTGGTGVLWRQWNRKMRDQFVEQQEKAGHAKGSWFMEGRHNERGGRIYMTSLATMSLEIYYRYMPIYKSEAIESDLSQ